MPSKLTKLISLFISFCLIFEQTAFAENTLANHPPSTWPATDLNLPSVGKLLSLSPKFNLPALKGLRLYSNDPFKFDFIIDSPDTSLNDQELKKEAEKLIKYFLCSLTIPEEDLWVNLSPYEQDRIIPPELGLTEMGKDLLEEDYLLKQLLSSLTYPESPLGKTFWDKVYKKAYSLFGTTKIPLNTFNKVWIIPDKAIVYEDKDKAILGESSLKVMLEEDYLAFKNRPQSRDHSPQKKIVLTENDEENINNFSSQIMKEVILPELEKEVNQGQNFAQLRQIYSSLILAVWFKQKLKSQITQIATTEDTDNAQEPLLQKIYVDKKKIKGVDTDDPQVKEKIYHLYVQAFKKGVYDYIKQDYSPQERRPIKRRYYSGGMNFAGMASSSLAAHPLTQEISFPGANPSLTQFTVGLSLPLASGDPPKQGASSALSLWPWSNKVSWKPHKPEDSPEVKKSEQSFVYFDPKQDFSGVSLEHFVVAQNRLAEQVLNDKDLERLLSHLGIKLTLSKEKAYQEIYKKLIQQGYSQEVIDLINGLTYHDPRLKIDVIDQNQNPRRQAVLEAIANSLDALGYNIGKFGKGVKQILDWLSPTGADRIDVWTKEKGGLPYQLTILKDTLGQEYIQIKEISSQDFLKAGAQDTEQGTIVRITIQDHIPLTEQELDYGHRNSQQAIIDGIRKRFPLVTFVRITTQIGKDEAQEVNGFGTKEVIVPAQAPSHTPQESEGKDIRIKIDTHTITIIDNGKGMNAETLPRMFVPKQGTKHPESLSAEQAREELGKVKVVRDIKLPHGVSFARNSRVAVFVAMPEDIIPQATTAGGLMLEFALLLGVPESWEQIRIPSNLKPGEVSNFQLAVEYAVKQIISHPDLSDIEKIQYINTLVLGLEGLIQKNVHYAYVVKNIKANLRPQLTEIIHSLKKKGFIILPHNKQFAQLSLPEGKKALFVNQNLVDWRGAISLKEIGASIIPGVTLGGERHLPLVVIPFSQESLEGADRFHPDWHTWEESRRIPIIKTDSFIALPQQFLGVQRILELATKQSKGARFKPEEEEEFSALLQMIDIISAEKVVTSYELTEPPKNLMRALPEFVKIVGDKIDSAAINSFLVQPPPVVSGAESKTLQQQVPPDANQRYVVLENGEVVEAGTGRKVGNEVNAMEFLRNGYYKVIRKEHDWEPAGIAPEIHITEDVRKILTSRPPHTEIYKLENGEPKFVVREETLDSINFSADKRFAYVQSGAGKIESIFDLESGQKYSFENCYDLQFSQDGRYLTYRKGMPQIGSVELIIVTISPQEIIKTKTIDLGVNNYDKYESAVNPFANVVFVQNIATKNMQLIDLETGTQVAPERKIKHLRADSTGTYTVIVDVNNKISIYLNKAKELLTAKEFGIEQIESVHTIWLEGQRVFSVFGYNPADSYAFDIDGKITNIHSLDRVRAGEGYGTNGVIFNWSFQQDIMSWRSSQKSFFSSLDYSTIDALQRLSEKGAYKHPRFNLFIDNSNPDKPIAIEPARGKKFPYQGEVVYYQPEKELWSYHQGRGKLYHYNLKYFAESTTTYEAISDHSSPPKFLAFAGPGEAYFLLSEDSGGYIQVEETVITKDVYPSASFDGKYFVLYNPHNGNTVYLNPQKPSQPIFVSSKAELPGIGFAPSQEISILALEKLIGSPVDSPKIVSDYRVLSAKNFLFISDRFTGQTLILFKYNEEGKVTSIYSPHQTNFLVDRLNYLIKLTQEDANSQALFLTTLNLIKGLPQQQVVGDFAISQTIRFKLEAGGIQKEIINFEKRVKEEEQKKALELWNERILSQRDTFIALVRASYLPLLDLIPEEYKGEIERAIRQEINKLYQEQEKEIRKRYQSVFEGKPLDLDTPLPFDLFQARMSKIMAKFPGYIAAVKDELAQEEYSTQKNFYSSLFVKIFALGSNFDLTLDGLELEADFFEILGLGWNVNNQEGFESIALIAEFINSLKQAVSNQLKLSESISMIQFLSSIKHLLVLKKQLRKLLSRRKEVRNKFLERLYSAFKKVEIKQLLDYLVQPQGEHSKGLAEMRPFLIFLTQEVDELKEKERFIPKGEDVPLPADGVETSQIIKWELQRQKKGREDGAMDIDDIDIEDFIRNILNLPPRSANLEKKLLEDIYGQRESGADSAEIAQNSSDAEGKELVVSFYLQINNSGVKEYVEEATDDGTGALDELALLIPKSTKAKGRQIELTGYFGTGKYTIFKGVDRVEIITKNNQRAFMFTFIVNKDEGGKPLSLKLTGIRRVQDEKIKQGVTVRRIKEVNNTIPELDAMLSQRSWKIFTALAQDENFKIYFIDNEGKKQPLRVEKEVLSEIDFRTNRPGEDQETNFGKLRIIATQDMPLQIVDRAGLRVCEIKEEYLALIPHSLRKHIQELGLVIQIPLPLIRNRSAFEHENEYLPIIQRYVAIAFYKAIVYKTLTQTTPQFVFENLPLDWETNDDYWKAITLKDKNLVSLAERINRSRYKEIREEELNNLLPAPGRLDQEKKFLKLMLLLEVAIDQNKPESRTSLLLRRLSIQQKISEEGAKSQQGLLRKIGLNIGSIPIIEKVPLFEQKLLQAIGIKDAHKQMRNPEKYIVSEEKYLETDKKLVKKAFSIARHFGIEQVVLMQEVQFPGAFKEYQGKKTMFLNRSLAWQNNGQTTDTIIHELVHFLEQLMREDETARFWKKGFVAHLANFTHDAVGTFAEAMKYAATVSLARYGLTTSSPVQTEMQEVINYKSPKPASSSSSQKPAASIPVPGGIDLNPENMDIEVKEGATSPITTIPFNPQIDLQTFEGFSFQILKMKRLKDFQELASIP